MRFVLDPGGRVVPDLAARLPGRGVWVRAERAAIETARRKGAFQRGLKAGIQIGEDLADEVERLLAQRCLALLGLGRKAGLVTFGRQKVEAAIRAAAPAAMIEACDGGADGRVRLYKLCKAAWGAPATLVGCFGSGELGVALGRDHVIHACWLQDRMARRWVEEIDRLAGFRAIIPAAWRAELPGLAGSRNEAIDRIDTTSGAAAGAQADE